MTASAPNPLLAILGGALQAALARVLALDPDAAARLAPLEGRSIELTWAPAALGLRLNVVDGALRVGPRATEPDLSMTGTLAGFAKLLFPQHTTALPASRVQMAGDAELARALAALAERYRPDLEAALTPTLGANTAALVVGAVREAASVAQRAASSLAVDAAEFVREESRDTPAREEVDDFHRDVDTLRDRVERLAARADALRRALERKP